MSDTQLMGFTKTITLNKLLTLVTTVTENVVFALIILLIGLWLSKKLANMLGKLLEKRKVEDTVAQFATRMLRYILVLFVVMAVLSELGVQTASLIALVGGMSLAIGLSLRSSLSNLASGILLVLFRPFRLGQFIQVNGHSGTVKAINLLYTELISSDQKMFTVPNDQFMKNVMTNFSMNSVRRIDFMIGIGYEDDIDRAKGLLQALIQADSRIMSDPAPMVVVKELADSAVNLLARFTVARTDYLSVLCEYTEAAKKRFDEAGVSMPYPQTDVHLHQ